MIRPVTPPPPGMLAVRRSDFFPGLAVGLLAMVTAAATLATRRPGSWRAG
ncbi:MAG: hypothetical protein ACLP8X_09420 [Streptosporangiaceae bacterium]